MHIPPYHKKRSWQLVLLGIALGTLIGYMVLAFMQGKMYEQILTEKIQLETEINELKRQNEALLEDKEDLKEESSAVILSIDIDFSNNETLNMDKLTAHQLEDLIKQELDPVIGKQVESVDENAQLIIDIIENKTFTIDDLSYELEVKRIAITSKIQLSLHIEPPE